MNPSFYVIEWDQEYMVPVNIQVYLMELQAANANPDLKPEWKLDHDFRTTFKMDDLSPTSFKYLN
jgi:hypothetical protein